MLIADGSIVVTALPKIHQDLHFSISSLSWVQSAYLIAGGGMLLLGARIGDYFGRRRIFMIGLALFMLASLGAGVAQNSSWLIGARFLQGLASALLAPSTLALLSTCFPSGSERARALAIYGSITGIGTSVGLVLGGFITATFSWNWAFLINVPIGIALLLATKNHIPETEPHRGKIDFLGAILSTSGALSLVYGIVRSSDVGWASPDSIGYAAAGGLLLVSFYVYETKVSNPLLPLHLVKNKERSGANLARLLFVGSMNGFWFFLSQYLESVRHLTPFGAGLAFLPMTMASFAVAFMVPRLSKKFGDLPFLIGGLLTVGLGTFWLGFLSEGGNYFLMIALPMLFVGLGQGASTIRLTTAAMAGVSPAEAGAASAVVNTAVQLGGGLGFSVLIAVAATTSTHVTTDALMTNRAHLGLTAGSALIGLALVSVLVFVVPSERTSRKLEAKSTGH